MPRDVDVGHRGLELIVDLLGRSRVLPGPPTMGFPTLVLSLGFM